MYAPLDLRLVIGSLPSHHSTAQNLLFHRKDESAEEERGGRPDAEKTTSLGRCSAQTRLNHLPAHDHTEDNPEKKPLL